MAWCGGVWVGGSECMAGAGQLPKKAHVEPNPTQLYLLTVGSFAVIFFPPRPMHMRMNWASDMGSET